MKVLAAVVVPPHLTVSGAARAAESLSLALARHCDMTLATMIAGGDAPVVGAGDLARVPVRTWLPPGLGHPAVPNRFRTLFYRSDMSQRVGSRRYDLVHLHNPMPALEMRRIARTCRRLAIPYVVSTHGFNEVVNGLRIYGFNAWQRLAWRQLVIEPVREVVAHAARIFALSPDDIGLLQALGQRTDRVTVVSNGVPSPEPGHDEEDARLLARLGVEGRTAGGPPTLLFLANHTPNKGLPVLIEACRDIREPFQLIVGGERRDGVAYDSFQAACRDGQRVVVTGRLTDAEAAACFRRADIFVFPTLADTFPLVVLEAMAAGLAVVASRVGGIPHQIGPDEGVLVEAGRPAALAEALGSLLRDPDRARRLGETGRRRARTTFTWESAAKIAMSGYAAVLAEAADASDDHRIAQGSLGLPSGTPMGLG
ncbi:hypothetical protein ASG43_05190 [Aureimonas sp. Leaf454]|uniref:glycosyltransferase family 4 protein n=1 Tax=Aureimonas sp. Leaf454 TaxID=1736381 RepID=UPI0006F778E5|nr:glycosyltransferase family 4 protein [Aureimonas sp. Leaf454]KQT50682.1 hypothetical protein ASG43_05190 [Aureimonas sp. Leaf454]